MIEYDPGRWGIWFALSLKGSVFPKAFAVAGPCSAGAMIMHRWLQSDEKARQSVEAGQIGASVLSGFTFILGFLIVFRSQQAYSRWWEGGTLLQQLRGEWFNAFSSLLAFSNMSETKSREVLEFQHRLARLVSLLYGAALNQVTTIQKPKFHLLNYDGFESDTLGFLQDCHDPCEIVLQWIQKLIVEANSTEVIKIAPPILSRVYNQLGNGIVGLNNARKITEFPIPFPLAQMVTFMLIVHLGMTLIICASSIEKMLWAGFVSFIVVFSFWSINYIALELEMPFGDDPNDLPLYEMQDDLNKSLKGLMEEKASRPPKFNFDESRDGKLEVVGVCFDTYEAPDDSIGARASLASSPSKQSRNKRRKSLGLGENSADLRSPKSMADKLTLGDPAPAETPQQQLLGDETSHAPPSAEHLTLDLHVPGSGWPGENAGTMSNPLQDASAEGQLRSSSQAEPNIEGPSEERCGSGEIARCGNGEIARCGSAEVICSETLEDKSKPGDPVNEQRDTAQSLMKIAALPPPPPPPPPDPPPPRSSPTSAPLASGVDSR